MPTVTKEWTDKRSGPVGCLAGNLILDQLGTSREVFEHLKGTIFVSPRRLVVGRVCSKETYLSGEWIHFCNLTRTHHKSLKEDAENRSIEYLFITVRETAIDYWRVPYHIVGKILAKSKIKESDSACILRIRFHQGRYYMLDTDITPYHKSMILNPALVRNIRRLESADKNGTGKVNVVSVDERGNKKPRFIVEYRGQKYRTLALTKI